MNEVNVVAAELSAGAIATAVAPAALLAVLGAWAVLRVARRRRAWRHAASEVERASFHCSNGDERSKRVQP